MTNRVVLDFETQSRCDISDHGAWNYSCDPTTRVLCLAYAVNDERAKIWIPPSEAVRYIFNVRATHKGLTGHFSRVRGLPKRVTKAMAAKHGKHGDPFPVKKVTEWRAVNKGWNWDGALVLPVFARYRIKYKPDFITDIIEKGLPYELEAHNAFFEKSIWKNICQNKFGFPSVSDCVWSCSAALASVYALPRSLDGVGAALDLPVKKNHDGKLVMMQLAKPKPDGTWDRTPHKFTKLYEYCLDDVRAEREVTRRLKPLSAYERRVWLLDQEINERGVPVDLTMVRGAIQIIDEYSARLEKEMESLTGGKLTNIRQVASLQLWLEENKVLVDNVQKGTIENVLQRKNLPGNVRRVLEIRQALGQTSTAKYRALLAHACSDERLRDQFLYAGASTLRHSGRGVQLQNFPRGSLSYTDQMIASIRDGSWRQLQAQGDVMDILSSSIRGAIASTANCVFFDYDFSNIEGRVMAWLAGEEWKIQAFKDFDNGTGPDLYILAYSKAFGIPIEQVTKDQRQIGKVMELALQYAGSVGAFQNMAAAYGVQLDEDTVKELVRLWRAAHPAIVQFWADIEAAAKRCVITKSRQEVNDKCWFTLEDGFLFLNTVAGSRLAYYSPSVQTRSTPWGDRPNTLCFWGVNSVTRKFELQDTYSGRLAENITQHLARMCLTDKMLELDDAGFDIVMHVHDQVMAEVPENDPELTEAKFGGIMRRPLSWCPDLPLAAEGSTLKRFKK